MKHRIFQHIPSGMEEPTEVKKFELFVNRAGYTCYYMEVNKFDRNPGTSFGWAKGSYDPQSKSWVEFPYNSHYCHFDIFNVSCVGPERALTVFLVPENEDEEKLTTNSQACVRWEPWGFRVCLIPDWDFFEEKSLSAFY